MTVRTIDGTLGDLERRIQDLRKSGLADDERVTVVVGRPSLREIAARMRATGVSRGLSDEDFDRIATDD